MEAEAAGQVAAIAGQIWSHCSEMTVRVAAAAAVASLIQRQSWSWLRKGTRAGTGTATSLAAVSDQTWPNCSGAAAAGEVVVKRVVGPQWPPYSVVVVAKVLEVCLRRSVQPV